MKVLVTGGTGFVGREILRELSAAGHAVRVLARDPASPAARALTRDYAVEVHPGNVLEPETLASASAGVEAVIHLVGIIAEAGRQTFERIHTDATRAVVAAAGGSGVRRYIHMSALGTRPGARSRYHQTKWAAEQIVRGSGLEWTIFRPSLIYGAGDRFVNRFAALARWSPVLPVIGSGQGRLQPVSVGGVARAFVRALPEPRSMHQTYDLCGPERLTFVEILDAILEVSGRRRWKVRVPLGLAVIQAGLLENLCGKLLRIPPPLNRDQIQMLQEDNVGDPAPAEILFGVADPGFRQGIREFLRPGDGA